MAMRTKFLSMTTACVVLSGSLISSGSFALDGSHKSLLNISSNNSHLVKIGQGREQEAETFITIMAQRGIDFLANPSLSIEQRKVEFKKLLQDNFDIKTLGRFSLGRYWNVATEQQKNEYLNLFEKNVIEVYSKRFGDYQGQDFKVVSARAEGKADAIVSSFIDSNGQKISIDWRVREKGGKMSVIDIIVEGVSMATTQRSEFSSIIQRGGGNVQVLIDHLKS